MNESPSPTALTQGIRILNSGFTSSQVYKNELDGMDKGLIGEGINHNGYLNPKTAKGLQFLCNKHKNMDEIDIYATLDNTDLINLPLHGIRKFQTGSSSSKTSAGNRFSQSGSSDPERHIKNTTTSPIFYKHTGGITEPDHFTLNKVFPGQVVKENTCPSHLSDGIDSPLDPSTEMLLITHVTHFFERRNERLA